MALPLFAIPFLLDLSPGPVLFQLLFPDSPPLYPHQSLLQTSVSLFTGLPSSVPVSCSLSLFSGPTNSENVHKSSLTVLPLLARGGELEPRASKLEWVPTSA